MWNVPSWDVVDNVTADAAHRLVESGEWIELGVNGWDSLIAWSVGPQHLLRCVEQPDHWQWTYPESPDRTPMTGDEISSILDDVDEYLADADIPAQPRGYRWFLHLPPNTTEKDFQAAFIAVQSQVTNPPLPHLVRPGFEAAAASMYAKSSFHDP